MTNEAVEHLRQTELQGRDLHACPLCGKLYECDSCYDVDKHWINCVEHGQQVGVGNFYVHPKPFKNRSTV